MFGALLEYSGNSFTHNNIQLIKIIISGRLKTESMIPCELISFKYCHFDIILQCIFLLSLVKTSFFGIIYCDTIYGFASDTIHAEA